MPISRLMKSYNSQDKYNTTMKRFYFIVLCLVSIISCSSPERVAEKALKDFGGGLFTADIISPSIEKINMFRDHGDVYSRFLMGSDEAESILDLEYKKDSNIESYFMTDILFNDCVLVSKKEITTTKYGYSLLSEDDPVLNPSTIQLLKEHNRETPNFYKEVGDYFLFKYDDVPLCELKYKLDNKYLATVIVIKVPDVGYRVCAVWIH